jgi:hypothetical protein
MTQYMDFELNPAIRLNEGRTIRTIGDAIKLLREHEARPGVDDRDEVLHLLERAQDEQQRDTAITRFRGWIATWGMAIPTALEPGSTRGMES